MHNKKQQMPLAIDSLFCIAYAANYIKATMYVWLDQAICVYVPITSFKGLKSFKFTPYFV